jgi:hypothetical protein
VIVGPPASVAGESGPLEAASATVLSLTTAVLSLVIVSTVLRPVVSESVIRDVEPVRIIVVVSAAPVAAWDAEVLWSLVPKFELYLYLKT